MPTRKVVYICSENPLYMFMTMNSINMLREFSPIPIEVIFIDNFPVDYPRFKTSKKDFLRFCEDKEVEVSYHYLPEDWFGWEVGKDIWVFRYFLQTVECANVLYLESDTFVFGNVEDLFDNEVDIAAVPSDWAYGTAGWKPLADKMPVPFNPGIVLWKNWCMQLWASWYLNATRKLQTEPSEIKDWLFSTHPTAKHAEEISLNIFTLANDLSFRFMESWEADVLKVKKIWDHGNAPIVFHSYTNHWKYVYNQITGIKPKLIGKKLK